MRRPILIATLLLPLVFAALPLLAVFMSGSNSAYAGTTVAVTPSVVTQATSGPVATDDTRTQAIVRTQTEPCIGGTPGLQG